MEKALEQIQNIRTLLRKLTKTVKVLVAALVTFVAIVGAVACSSDADVASENLSKDAENFKINRRVVFYNGITDTYILQIEGFCSVELEEGNTLTVTCKVGNQFKKHFLGRSDNVTWFAEQIEGANVSTKHYKVIFKPSTIVPDVEAR